MNEFLHDDACMQALSDSSNAFVFFSRSFFSERWWSLRVWWWSHGDLQ